MREYFANILISDIEEYRSLKNKLVLDVGGAKGEFCRVLKEERNCNAINLDPEINSSFHEKNLVSIAESMPFKDEAFDVVICRGVMEHIYPEKQQKSLDEIYRVTKDNGLCYIMIPPWYGFHAGHQFKPFHIFGFKIAKFLSKIFSKKYIEGRSFKDNNIFPITFKKFINMARKSNFFILAVKDFHFRLHFIAKIPILREIFIPSAAFFLIKRGG